MNNYFIILNLNKQLYERRVSFKEGLYNMCQGHNRRCICNISNGKWSCNGRYEAKVFFTFFGLDAITKKKMNKLHTGVVGNPAMSMPGGIPFPTVLGVIPFVEAGVSAMMKSQMAKLDIPPVDEFLDMIIAGGGEIYACKLAADMFKLKKEDFSEHVKDIITVGEFYAMAGGQGTQIIFT